MIKRLIFICLGCIYFSLIDAQVLGIKGGLSFARGRYVIYEVPSTAGSLFGVNTGIIGEVPVSDALSLSSGICFIKKGARSSVYKLPVRYIEFPINLVYRIDFITWKLFAQTGPFIGVGISARKKSDNYTDKITFGPEAPQFKRMDFGINLGTGFEINNLQIGVNYGYGFRNISNVNREVLRNRVISVSAVYFIEDLGYTLGNLKDAIF